MLKEGKGKKFNYFPGQMYVGTRATVEVPIYKANKKKPETQKVSFEGYENIIIAMTNEMQAYFEKKMK